MQPIFETTSPERNDAISFAREKDKTDPLRDFRSQFEFPDAGGRQAIYFCGNSLGLQPKSFASAWQQEMEDWKSLGVLGYTRAKNPWLYYQHGFRMALSKIAGCSENEVTAMNTLTVNLHLMLLSFYRPNADRFKILMEKGAFPSDQYAVETQVRFYGLDPEKTIIEVAPLPGEKSIREGKILESIEAHRANLALVLLGGINYYSGQLFDMKAIAQAARQAGARVGFDLAHAIGNVELSLHDWDVDFAVWCSYKYLNGGPGAVGAAFIHERHAKDSALARLGGWWGNDEKTRFLMEKGFHAKPDASGWNISTAQVFNMVGLKASLELFEKTNMKNIRAKSLELTGYLEQLLRSLSNLSCDIITPADPSRRGAQLSLYFPEYGREIHQKISDAGIIVDYREPGVIRVAPAPLYNSFEDVCHFCGILHGISSGSPGR
jgi:kynureninase